MIRPVLVLILFLVFAVDASGQEKFIVKKDLQSEWLVNTENKYVAFGQSEKPVNTIYFTVKPNNFKGDYLVLTGANHFSIMLNGELILDQIKKIVLSIDSLKKNYPESAFFFAVHQEQSITQADLETNVQSKVIAATVLEKEHRRLETSFRDFVVTATLVLFIFLVGLIRLNPRLSSDYFSVTKLFSLRDSDIDQFYYRLTSGNILFYVLTSLILAFYLIVIGQFVKIEVTELNMEGYSAHVLTWLKVSVIIFALLFVKMFIVYVVASLFGVRDIAGLHFFNFIRLLLIFIGILTLILATYHLLHGQQKDFYNFFLQALGWILGGWVILLFLKLTNRVRYTMFHLFSYICATEIIPFLLIVKVLNE
jgi:hypothetical protein